MPSQTYIYNVNYSEYEETLCAIEKRSLFGSDLKEKVFYSEIEVNPSVSPFLKNRLEIIYKAKSYESLLELIKEDSNIKQEFIIKYIKLFRGDPYAKNRNSLCKEIINLRSEIPNYENPKIIYGVTHYEDQWYFGVLEKNNSAWKKHDKRPYTYSNSLKMNMAKVLVNLAGQGDLSKKIIDPCCGAGTVLLEGCFAGYEVTGSDISWKTARNARANLAHFGYEASVNCEAIQEVQRQYDSSIIDLPYGLYSQITPEQQQDIIKHAKRISKRVVVISSEDISHMIHEENMNILDACQYIKSVNRAFTRYIYICE